MVLMPDVNKETLLVLDIWLLVQDVSSWLLV